MTDVSAGAEPTRSWRHVARLGVIALQVLLVLLVMREFRLVSPAVADVLKLCTVGFVVHALAPARFRMVVFILLSVAAILHVLGPDGGGRLLLVGVGLIGLTRLPIAWSLRVGALLLAGGVLTAGRAAWIPLPLGQAVWPLLGSMFMFRLIVYVYDVRHDPTLGTWSGALAYFFMLPNVAFPFFPVVDYKTFVRTRYDREASGIYQTGVAWMLRGVVHLILYRFVYYYLTLAPEDVQSSGQLLRFAFSNYALYLRVSGTFHLIVGVLHLFGFNLPVTNHFYFLASSFTDYWRRINIYWKDFMMKTFYYPSYFGLRRLGNTWALVLATALVFVVTTLLHTYQWFWLRGDWYLSTQDALFWTALGALVILNVVVEARRGRRRSLGTRAWTPGTALLHVGRTLLMFTVLASLWSLWTAPSVEEWLGMWSVWRTGAPFTPSVAVALLLAVVILVAAMVWTTGSPQGRAVRDRVAPALARWRESPALILAGCLGLLAVSSPAVQRRFGGTALLVVEDLQHDRLNRRDQEQLERGYYENLFGVERTNPELAELYSRAPEAWRSLWQTEAVRPTGDLRRLEMVPQVSMTYKGVPFSTNEWGMRDRPRSARPAEGTFRFAVLGASTTMGSGVRDEETFPRIVESRFADAGLSGVELLNFAVESYNAIEQVAVTDAVVPRFAPHALLYVAHETEFEKTMAGVATFVENRTDLAYDSLAALVAATGIGPGQRRTIALRLLNAERERIIGWAYRHIAASARSRGMLPIWVFVPMPVPGTGPCPPGSAQLFCFGNLSRVGAAADASDPRVARLMALARAAGFVTLDLSHVYGTADLTSLWIAAGDGHPNATGHRMIAGGLYEALRRDTTVSAAIARITERSTH